MTSPECHILNVASYHVLAYIHFQPQKCIFHSIYFHYQYQGKIFIIVSTLTAIIFLHYRLAAKTALEIFENTAFKIDHECAHASRELFL